MSTAPRRDGHAKILGQLERHGKKAGPCGLQWAESNSTAPGRA